MNQHVCVVCGSSFNSRNVIRRYCSPGCYYSHKKTEYISMNCMRCGQPVEMSRMVAQKYHLDGFCSKACKQCYRTGETHQCLNCGKEVYRAPSMCGKFNRAYCSKKCMSEHYRGEIHHGYIDGRTLKYCEKFNSYFKYRVRAYFNFCCFECGVSEENLNISLHVHHVNYDRQTCCNEDIPLFVPLCAKCHAKTNGSESNRVLWKEHLTHRLNVEHGLKCFFTAEEVTYDAWVRLKRHVVSRYDPVINMSDEYLKLSNVCSLCGCDIADDVATRWTDAGFCSENCYCKSNGNINRCALCGKYFGSIVSTKKMCSIDCRSFLRKLRRELGNNSMCRSYTV